MILRPASDWPPTWTGATWLDQRFAPREPRAAIETARARSPQLALARAAGAAAALEVDLTRNGLLPGLDLTVAGGPVGSDASPRAAFTELAQVRG